MIIDVLSPCIQRSGGHHSGILQACIDFLDGCQELQGMSRAHLEPLRPKTLLVMPSA